MKADPLPAAAKARVLTAAPPVALIGFGQVRHRRLKPVANAFCYPTYFLLLPLRSLQANGPGALARNRRAPLSFYDADHGDGRALDAGGALGWLDDLLRAQGILDASGEVWLHTYPRVLGYSFKPVSFWYCHGTDGALRAVVVEVNNTFGQRHCYLLERPRYGQDLYADKVFHVSPFCAIEGSYRFRFLLTPDLRHTVARIDHDDDQGPLLQTSVSGTLEALTPESLRRALWRYPAMTWGVVARIHWQALRLFCKRAPFFAKPAPPASFVSR
jgi:DUF1365 family protein